MMAALIFFASGIILLYVYLGYPGLLILIRRLVGKKAKKARPSGPYEPLVTTIVAAYDEETHIERRIRNLLDADYPADRHEIIVGSDGSKDRTVEIARKYESGRLRVVDFGENRGRAAVHNDTVAMARGEIVVFTDAQTIFEPDFIRNIVRYFSDFRVGCVVGNLKYLPQHTSIADTEGFYFNLENRIRSLESDLGLLATGCGAAMAVRKSLWRPLKPTDDCDFTTPIDVILQGFRNVYAPDALAFDTPPASNLKGELRVRARMTSKNLIGTLYRLGFEGPLRYPGVGWALLSHKILRWFSPFFLLGAFFGNIPLFESGPFFRFTFLTQGAFYLFGLIGWVGEVKKVSLPPFSTVFSFLVANLGMGIGVIKGLSGRAPATYSKIE